MHVREGKLEDSVDGSDLMRFARTESTNSGDVFTNTVGQLAWQNTYQDADTTDDEDSPKNFPVASGSRRSKVPPFARVRSVAAVINRSRRLPDQWETRAAVETRRVDENQRERRRLGY